MLFVFAAALAAAPFAFGPSLQLVGTDPLSSAGTEHAVAVGSVTATNGVTTVTVYQVGRYTGDAAAAMAYSTSFLGFGWQEGLLPGITKAQNPANPYDRVTFETIAWNQRYNEFLVATLPISNTPSNGDSDTTLPPEVSRSSDGVHWTNPAPVAVGGIRPEKSWIACDNGPSSPHYGACYVAWDDNDDSDRFHVNVSTDGGQTWGPTRSAVDGHGEYGALPVILPNGNVVVTSEDSNGYDGTEVNEISSVSTDGGTTWSAAYEIAKISPHQVAANMRTQPLPTSAVDGNGTVYTIWQDCRFRSGCSSNDLVMSTSPNGVNWTAPERLNLDPVTSGIDHFLPALSIRRSLFGSTLGLSYYAFPQANCTTSTCQLDAAFANSGNGGATWSNPEQIAGPMNVTWLAATGAGYMAGDYFTSIYPNGYEAPIAVATAPNGPVYNEAIELPTSFFGGGLDRTGGTKSKTKPLSHLGLADGPALHTGGVRRALLPARLAPPPKHAHHHHPM